MLRVKTFVTVFRLCGLLSAFFGATVSAGENPTAVIGYAHQAGASIAYDGSAATVAAQEHYALLDWPVHVGDGQLVALGFNYQYTRYEYSGISSRNRDLHHLQLPVRLEHSRADRRVSAYLAPGIATSSNVFKDFLNRGSADDWYLSGAVEARFGRPSQQWLLGAAYDRSFGESRFYPILGLRSSPHHNLDVRLAFPVSGIAWRHSGRSTLTGRVMPAGFEWHVVTDDFANEFNYRVEGVRTQLNWTHRIHENWSVDVSAAYESDRHHDFVDSLGERVVGQPRDEWLFAISFGIGGALPVAPNGIRIQSITN